MAEETVEMRPGRSPEGRDFSFHDLSEMFSDHYFNILTRPLRLSSAICSLGSLLTLVTSMSTSYWVTERSTQGLIHSGLWEVCLGPKCDYFPLNVPEYLHVTRAFLMMALLCGVASLVSICISFERVSIGPIYFMVVAGLLCYTTAFLTLIGISVFTAVNKSKEKYVQYLLIFGSSYGLCWASIPTYILTGLIIMTTHRTSRY